MTSPLVLRDRIDSFPTDQVAGYNVRPGRTFPFGATLVPGGCRVTSGQGEVDADLNAQLDRIAAKLIPGGLSNGGSRS